MCASTTSAATAPSTWTRSRAASRRRPRSLWCSTPPSPPVLEAGLQHSGGKAILNSANLEEGEDDGQALRPRDVAGARVRRRGHLPRHRRRGPGSHAPTASCGSAAASTTSRPTATASIPTDLIFDMLTFPLGSGSEDLRRDGIETIEAIRRAKAELPGSSTMLGLSNISFGLKPAIRHVLNSVFLHECREAGLDAAIVARGAHHADAQDRRPRARGHARPRLRPSRATATTRSPSSWRCSRASTPPRSSRKTAPAGRSSSGSSTASSTATATASRPTSRSSSVASRARRSSTRCCSRA